MQSTFSLPSASNGPLRPIALVNGLYTGTEKGLAADLLAARSLGLLGYSVCTQLIIASHGKVTDLTDVPSDTVAAQLGHLRTHVPLQGMAIGMLGGHQSVEVIMQAARALEAPILLDLTAHGPSGETVLSERARSVMLQHLAVPDLVMIERHDAEWVAGGEIHSLDDAQVAAQRMHRRGARRVVIKCGRIAARFFDPADDPGATADDAFAYDLYYDGEEFALFEAPHIPFELTGGAGSLFALAVLAGRLAEQPFELALQQAKRTVTEAIVRASVVDGGGEARSLDAFWPLRVS